jgi:hypothetical protein
MREFVIRIRLPERPRKRWLIGGAALVLGLGAIAYAALPYSFNAGDALSAAKVSGNFADLDSRSWQGTGTTRTFNGKVGIGVASPSQSLEVGGGIVSADSSGTAYYMYTNDTGYVYIGPRSGTSANGAGVTLGGATNSVAGAGQFRLNTPNAAAVSLLVTSDGKVGMGTPTPASRLDLGGGCMTGSTCSDRSLKSDIRPLPADGSSLAKVLGMRGKSFEWKSTPGHRAIGLVAQEVEAVAPEVVTTSPADGQKGISCTGIEALVVEAIRSQEERLQRQEQEIAELRRKLR